jgi:hypothetical protein
VGGVDVLYRYIVARNQTKITHAVSIKYLTALLYKIIYGLAVYRIGGVNVLVKI